MPRSYGQLSQPVRLLLSPSRRCFRSSHGTLSRLSHSQSIAHRRQVCPTGRIWWQTRRKIINFHRFFRSVDGDRDLSDSEESPPSRYRSYSQPPSRRGSVDYSNQSGPNQRPALMVRRVGSRQMLVLGDEASIHGKKITCSVISCHCPVHLLTKTIPHVNRSSVQDLRQISYQPRNMRSCQRCLFLAYTLLDSPGPIKNRLSFLKMW